MKMASSIRELPNQPAIYVLRSGRGSNSILYVGQTDNLRRRIGQHLKNRDSSITMEGSPVKIDPGLVEKVEWWEQTDFSDPTARKAAEQIAFEVLNPRVRSGTNGSKGSIERSKDKTFRNRINVLFNGPPSGTFTVATLESVIERLLRLESRLTLLEKHIEK